MKLEEIWKPVIGYEDKYEVSNLGRVRSFYLRKIRNDGILQIIKQKKYGYGVVCLNDKYKNQSTKRVHRLVLETFTNKKGICVNHKDGNKLNNKLNNLEWCTHKENAQHCRKNNLQYTPKGNELSHAKLNPNKVKQIRKLYKSGKYSMVGLGKLFNVCGVNIFHIVHNLSWRHIK